jgi:D-alanyl-lipoteichoic acid acyltransferase DltB (MBOAT superfamily)
LTGAGWHFLHIVLPLGISFITFQKIAYLVESYRGVVKPRGFINYCLFISFFPQLIAGPIVRYEEISHQLAAPLFGKFRWDMISAGLFVFSIGLAKKVLLADGLAQIATPLFDRAEMGLFIYSIEAWQAVLAYAFQIYFDFSGYSDMAIGLALMLGVRLPENFLSPYKARNVVEFWRRWHITLSRFLRDYIYIPLGGNRKGPVRRYMNLAIVMLLGGLWHGATWNFVIWGGLHGLYLIVNHAWGKLFPGMVQAEGIFVNGLKIAATFMAICFAWVFFRAATLDGAFVMLEALAGVGEQPSLLEQIGLLSNSALFMLPLSGFIVWKFPASMTLLRNFQAIFSGQNTGQPMSPVCWIGAGLILAFSLFVIFAGSYSEFIYFQF